MRAQSNGETYDFFPRSDSVRGTFPASGRLLAACRDLGAIASVKRLDHGGVEAFVIDCVGTGWFWTGAPYYDHDLRCGIYVDGLSEDAGSEECAFVNRIGGSILNPPNV